jgi:Protein of unknown function (DUF4239)
MASLWDRKGFTMIDWLNSLPDAVIVIGFAVLMGGLIVVIPLIMRSLPIVAPTPENTEFVMRIQGTLFVMSGFALAFTLAQAQANVRHVDALVAAEAAHINNLDRILTRYGETSVAAIRPDLMTYANSVATLEWEAMHHDKEHEPTMQAFAPVARAITAINPTNARQATLFTEMMKSIDQIMESRALRLEAVHIALPGIYWGVVIFAMGVLVLASCVIERTPFRNLALATQMSVLGAFIGILFITDHPFHGESSIGPDAFVKAMSEMKARRN